MSNYSIATLPRISPSALAALLRASPNATSTSSSASPAPSPQRPVIIDVRDSDFIGGHILGCENHPVDTHEYAMPELVRKLRDTDVVVFHCVHSQQRGPGSALRYLRERERMMLAPAAGAVGADAGAEGEGKGEGAGRKAQKVYVLEGGFNAWQQMYGDDEALTEGYQKDIWEFGH